MILDLLTLTKPTVESPEQLARYLRENFERIRDLLTPRSNELAVVGARLAAILGGEWLEGVVDAVNDTEFAHGLGRIPTVVFLSVAYDSNAGPGVRGIAAGGLAAPGNATPWTTSSVFVRATVTGSYGFMVI